MLDLSTRDTIAAVASAPGSASRGVVRISGPEVAECLKIICPSSAKVIACCNSGVPTCFSTMVRIDRFRQVPAEVLFWPTSASFTRQPTAEIHTFGSPPILDLILQELFRAGARGAQPGEFTLRAFLGGRIDLTQAEAVIAAIDAADEKSFFHAISQLAGGLTNPLTKLRSDLLDLLADIEAGLDFVDEDIAFVESDTILQVLSHAIDELRHLQVQLEQRQEHRVMPRVVLIGRPNAGKSSLLNRLANQGLTMVSPQAGTTRDYVSTTIHHGGLAFELVDTAGLIPTVAKCGKTEVNSNSFIEDQTQRFAKTETRRADLVLCCVDPNDSPTIDEINDWLRNRSGDTLLVFTKGDLRTGDSPREGVERLTREFSVLSKLVIKIPEQDKQLLTPFSKSLTCVELSAATGQGIETLLNQVVLSLTANRSTGEHLINSGARCLEAIARATDALVAARNSAHDNLGNEIVATDLRTALDSIGEITGAVHHDEVLNRLFSRFCIGK